MNPAWCSICKGLPPLHKSGGANPINRHDVSEQLIEALRACGAKVYMLRKSDDSGNQYTVRFAARHLPTLLPMLSGTRPHLHSSGTYEFHSQEAVMRLLKG